MPSYFLKAMLIGTFALYNTHAYAQTKLKSASSLKEAELENFLTVKHDYIKIPITKMVTGHLHVDVVLNGVAGEFILDSGAGATVVETSKKDKFGLKAEASEESGAGAGGTQSLQMAANNTMKIGGLTKQKFDIYIMNLDDVNHALTSMGLKEVDGVIGADILTENKAVIDYANLILYLQK